MVARHGGHGGRPGAGAGAVPLGVPREPQVAREQGQGPGGRSVHCVVSLRQTAVLMGSFPRTESRLSVIIAASPSLLGTSMSFPSHRRILQNTSHLLH